jgi:beta-galactosidase
MVFDWENWWAVENVAATLQGVSYVERTADYFNGFCEAGIDVDFVDMEDTLEGYEIVIAPMNYMYRGDYIDNVKRFVEQGGTYVTTYWSGESDASDLCFLEEHPLRELLGIRTEEIDVRPLDIPNQILYGDKAYEIKDLCALVHAETAEVLGTYETDFYQGYPALTRNVYGKGQAYFIAAEGEYAFIKDFYQKLLQEKNLVCRLSKEIPKGVLLTQRENVTEDKRVWFVMNFNPSEVTMSLDKKCVDVETGQELADGIGLQGYQCRIVKEV